MFHWWERGAFVEPLAVSGSDVGMVNFLVTVLVYVVELLPVASSSVKEGDSTERCVDLILMLFLYFREDPG